MIQARFSVPTRLVATIVIVFASALLSGSTSAQSSPATPRSQISFSHPLTGDGGLSLWRPAIIFNDGVEQTTFTVPIADGSFEDVYVTTEGVLNADEGLDALIQLFDDGTHGDETAGDGTWSRSGITASGKLAHDGGTHETLKNRLVFVSSDVATEPRQLPREGMSIVDVGQRGTITVSKLSAALFATSHALFLVDDGTNFPSYPKIEEDAITKPCHACRIMVETFGDVFDFVNIQVREHLRSVGIPEAGDGVFVAWNRRVIVDAEGIGLEPFNANSPSGTFSTRIRSILFSNEVSGRSLAHEVIHAWASEVGQSIGLTTEGAHYGPNVLISGINDDLLIDGDGFSVQRAGSINPTDLVANGDGTYRVVSRPGWDNPTFHPLTLYQAGFAPPSQVPPVEIIEGPDFTDLDRVTVTSTRTVTIEEIIALEGPRIPSSATAPKSFRLGTLVFGDRAYSEADYVFFTLALRYFESNKQYDGNGSPPWKAATLGLSTVTTALPALPASATTVTFATPPPPLQAASTATVAEVPPLGGMTYVKTAGTTDVQELIDAQPFAVSALFVFDIPTQTYRSFVVGAPPFVQTLTSLSVSDLVNIKRADTLVAATPGGVPTTTATVRRFSTGAEIDELFTLVNVPWNDSTVAISSLTSQWNAIVSNERTPSEALTAIALEGVDVVAAIDLTLSTLERHAGTANPTASRALSSIIDLWVAYAGERIAVLDFARAEGSFAAVEAMESIRRDKFVEAKAATCAVAVLRHYESWTFADGTPCR